MKWKDSSLKRLTIEKSLVKLTKMKRENAN